MLLFFLYLNCQEWAKPLPVIASLTRCGQTNDPLNCWYFLPRPHVSLPPIHTLTLFPIFPLTPYLLHIPLSYNLPPPVSFTLPPHLKHYFFYIPLLYPFYTLSSFLTNILTSLRSVYVPPHTLPCFFHLHFLVTLRHTHSPLALISLHFPFLLTIHTLTPPHPAPLDPPHTVFPYSPHAHWERWYSTPH